MLSRKSPPLPPRTPQPHSPRNLLTADLSPSQPQVSLQQPSHNKRKSTTPSKSTRLFRRFRSVFRSFPIINLTCRMPNISLHHGNNHPIQGGTRMTGTLFGYRKSSRINLVIQENPRCLPMVVLELSIPTTKFLQDMGSGVLVRIALECEKHHKDSKIKLMEEPIWTMYCNGRKNGYSVRREPMEDDLSVMQMLHAVSMGAGVLPSETGEGELTYIRAHFDRVVGSKDSETYYMMIPQGNDSTPSGPELSIFFVRI
ncbi:protein MIZU-KUSSEI 1-like [Actinidia eriantha]|uniref:protein MIZU-KUSSEI 1-like n=1 Tax=Actinidia eriantha TaxID=165200 RepID=UPI00258A2174|nr:protein MIZU-KUSSEI 1-like [Actinidia eriantha]